jgi:RNA polymerase sigma-70 factor, ECF subfamily
MPNQAGGRPLRPRWSPSVAIDRDGAADSGGVVAADSARPAEWIVAIAERQDRGAFALLFRFYAPRIKTMLMRSGASGEVAEDLAQETLLSVWRKAAQYDPKRAGAAAWIFTIARNLRTDLLRRNRRARLLAVYETVEETDDSARPDDVMDHSELQSRVRAALSELPEEQISVVRLSFAEGRAHGDIAKLLNLPLGTVKSRLRLAMNRLRNLLGESL